MHRFLIALLLVAAGTASATDAGGMTVTVRDSSGTGLPQSAGSGVDSYNPPQLSLNLLRIGTSYAFNDSIVDANMAGSGYTVTGYATDWIPKTVTNINVFANTTTAVSILLQRPVLSLSISPTTIATGGDGTATVTLKDGSGNAVTLRNNVTVTSSSSDTGKATVTQPATISAGSSSATFNVHGVAAGSATISVTSGTWGSASQGVTISP